MTPTIVYCIAALFFLFPPSHSLRTPVTSFRYSGHAISPPVPSLSATSSSAASATKPKALEKGDRVLLIGPGFLQLVIAKALKAEGLVPLIIAPQKKIGSFRTYINDDEIMDCADVGLPDEKGTVNGVVFCGEEALFGPNLVQTVLSEWGKEGGFVHDSGEPVRVVACAPITKKVNKEKSMGWMPIFNNDQKEADTWNAFVKSFQDHPVGGGSSGTLIRFGSLLGGSIDGAPELASLGLDECIYKMSLENYRDLKERSFDRFRLGAQVLAGDSINPKPPKQESLEKDALKEGEYKEVFRSRGGYPEVDRTNRHTLAQAVVQTLLRPTRGMFTQDAGNSVPQEFTVLSKCVSAVPTTKDWDELFANPGPGDWPDPTSFDPSQYDWEK